MGGAVRLYVGQIQSGGLGDPVGFRQSHPAACYVYGIVLVIKSGCRWRDCRAAYGPHTTVYNRFARRYWLFRPQNSQPILTTT